MSEEDVKDGEKVAKAPESEFCCEIMKAQLTRRPCPHHNVFECPDFLIVKFPPVFVHGPPRFAIPIKDGGESFIRIYFCPFCGKQLDSRW